MLGKAEEEFACFAPLQENHTDYCSTLSASCAEDEKIMIDKIHFGMKNAAATTCSTNETNCKQFLEGCCAYTDTDEIYLKSSIETWPIFDQCEGKRNCSFKASDIGLQDSSSNDFLMFEYFCVNGKVELYLKLMVPFLCKSHSRFVPNIW